MDNRNINRLMDTIKAQDEIINNLEFKPKVSMSFIDNFDKKLCDTNRLNYDYVQTLIEPMIEKLKKDLAENKAKLKQLL